MFSLIMMMVEIPPGPYLAHLLRVAVPQGEQPSHRAGGLSCTSLCMSVRVAVVASQPVVDTATVASVLLPVAHTSPGIMYRASGLMHRDGTRGPHA